MKAQDYTSPDFIVFSSVMAGSGFAASVENPAENEKYTVDNSDINWI